MPDARNEADALAYAVEKHLADRKDLAPADRGRVESAIADLRKAMEDEDVQAIARSTEALQRASKVLAEPRRTGPNVQEGEVVDAEPVETSQR